MRCLIASCINDMHLRMEDGGSSTHRIPTNPERNARWMQILSTKDCYMAQNARICSRHFNESDFVLVKGKRKLKKDAVPSLYLAESDENEFRLMSLIESPADIESDADNRIPLRNISNVSNGPQSSSSLFNSFSESHFWPADNVDPVMFVEQLDQSDQHSNKLTNQPILPELQLGFAFTSAVSKHHASGSGGGTTVQPKRIRYAGDVKDVASLTPQQALQAIPVFQTQLLHSQKRVSRLKQQNIYLKKKVASFSNIMTELKKRNMVDNQGELKLQEFHSNNELLMELFHGRRGSSYSNDMRRFATTLNFYSPKAYTFVRESFNYNLPNPRTIVRWYRSVDGEPGLTNESLAAIEEKAESLKGRPLLVSLCMDEVAIRQHTEWNPYNKKMEGIVDYGESFSFLNSNSDDGLTVAKEALVYMISSVEENWKIPVAFFFINGIGASDKKCLTEIVITALHDAGATVIGLTFDGTATNFAMANALGCNLRINGIPLKTSFKHPSTNDNIYVILDACHMLKLVRNMFASNGCLLTLNGKADWKFVEKLNEKQNLSGTKIAPNLSDRHVHFQNQKMKVLLAAQTLSESVAKSLEMLQSIDSEFSKVDATVQLIRIFNDLFDVMNSKNIVAKGYKKPMSEENFESLDAFMTYAEQFIRNIKLPSQDSVLQSICKTGFLGFLVNIHSFREMFLEYVSEKKLLSTIATYRFSQDHVETFFAAIRAKGGWNNNPTVSQFKAAYKRLITHNNVKSTEKANCVNFNESVMLVAGEKIKQCLNRINIRNIEDSDGQENFEEVKAQLLQGIPSIDSFIDDSFVGTAIQLNCYTVQKKLLQAVRCKKCVDGVLSDQTVGLVSKSIHIICKVTEVEFKILVGDDKKFNVAKCYDVLFGCILLRIQSEFNDVFRNLTSHIINDNEPEENHRIDLIKIIIDYYLNLRLTGYAKTVIPFKQSTRSKFTKLILFEGH